MDLLLIFISLMCVTHSQALIARQHVQITACSDTDKEFMLGVDGDEGFYADFEKKKGVIMLPPFAGPIEFPGLYELGESNMEGCKYNLPLLIKDFKDQPVPQVEPQVELTLVKKSDGSHPARLMCSAYSFYPPHIQLTWLRNGKKLEGDVTSTEEMADGDWYYQIHSDLEYMPESGEEISCVVEHASFQKPMEYKWDPSMSEPDKSKVAIGASGMVLGIVLSAAGFIYYRKKTSGRILVPT